MVEAAKYYNPTITAKKGIGYGILFLIIDLLTDFIAMLDDPFLKSSVGAVAVAGLVAIKNYLKNKDNGK